MRPDLTTMQIAALNPCTNEVVPKIFRIGAAIYTAVVVAQSSGPDRQNSEFRVLLPSFMETA
jgi:hypothetical protein